MSETHGATSRAVRTESVLRHELFIYALEGLAEYRDLMIEIGSHVDAGDIQAVTSELTLAECLAKPFADGRAAWAEVYEQALQDSPSLRVAPVTREVLIAAAGLRGAHRIGLADAIHLATAIAEECTVFLTNDSRLAAVSQLQVILLPQLQP